MKNLDYTLISSHNYLKFYKQNVQLKFNMIFIFYSDKFCHANDWTNILRCTFFQSKAQKKLNN